MVTQHASARPSLRRPRAHSANHDPVHESARILDFTEDRRLHRKRQRHKACEACDGGARPISATHGVRKVSLQREIPMAPNALHRSANVTLPVRAVSGARCDRRYSHRSCPADPPRIAQDLLKTPARRVQNIVARYGIRAEQPRDARWCSNRAAERALHSRAARPNLRMVYFAARTTTARGKIFESVVWTELTFPGTYTTRPAA